MVTLCEFGSEANVILHRYACSDDKLNNYTVYTYPNQGCTGNFATTVEEQTYCKGNFPFMKTCNSTKVYDLIGAPIPPVASSISIGIDRVPSIILNIGLFFLLSLI